MHALEAWQREYGENFVIRGALGKQTFVTTDLRALSHVLSSSDTFVKSESERRDLESFLGRNGVIWAQGEQHTRQRRILGPAFGHAAVRDAIPLFLEGSSKLCKLWDSACIASGGTARLDVTEWLAKATQSIIAHAAFDYDACTLNEDGKTSKLADAVIALFHANIKPIDYFQHLVNKQFPFLQTLFPSKLYLLATECGASLRGVGVEIVKDRKAAVILEGGSLEKNQAISGGDMMSRLLRANRDPALQLSDAELIAQIPTFIFAGYESFAITVSWAMYALARYPEAQATLRAEIQQLATETPTLDMLNSLSFLDCVVRETLRLYSFVPYIVRETSKDGHIPLERPAKDRDGTPLSHIRFQQGDEVIVPIWLVNRSHSIWGTDANEFRPERWEKLPGKATAIPGITPGHLTFSGGDRACLGHRFAVAEIKALLFTIVREFEFRLAVEPSEIWARSGQLFHPRLHGDNSIQLPILLTPIG